MAGFPQTTNQAGAGEAEHGCNLTNGVSLAEQDACCSEINSNPGTAAVFSGRPGPVNPGLDAFLNNVPLKFADGSNQGEDHPAYRGTSVNAFSKAHKLDSDPGELLKSSQKVLGGSGKPVELPNGNQIDLAVSGGLHHLIKSRP